jgi:hypothetical protein
MKCRMKILSVNKGCELEQYRSFRIIDRAGDVTFMLVYRSLNSRPETVDALARQWTLWRVW